MNKNLRKYLSLFLSLLLTLSVMMSCTACGSKTDASDETAATATDTAVTFENGDVVGEGATQFKVEVITGEGNAVDITVNTDKQTVGEALTEIGLISGEDSDYGLYVTTVNGKTADYDADQSYWAFFIDGVYAETGVDSTDVVAGTMYTFQYTQG